MKLHLDSDRSDHLISSYGPGRITVQEEILTRSFLITPDQLVRDWPPQTFEDLMVQHFVSIVDLQPEIVLFGSGAKLRFPDITLLQPLVDAGIGLEVMDTGAACRTFNVLLSEGRSVAGAMLIIRDE